MARLLLLVVLILAPLGVAAAILPTTNNLIGVSLSPNSPKPGERVVLTAHTKGDPGTYTFTWTRSGALVANGVGISHIELIASGAGTQEEVAVTLTDAAGAIVGSATAFLVPAEVDLMWEGNTYTPAFYLGRPLVTAASKVTILAVPRLIVGGAQLSPSTLVYRWEVNGSPLTAASGYGKSTLVMAPPSFSAPFTVSVRAETRDGSVAAMNRVTITPTQPAIVFYRDAPLTGIGTNRAVVGGAVLEGDEVTYRAFPLFVESLSALSYRWTLNGEPFVLDDTDPRVATFRKSGGETGAFSVGFSFSNARSVFEDAVSSFIVAIQ